MLRGSFAPGYFFAFTDRSGGVSTGAYSSRNLGRHVGDDPELVVRNRSRTAVELGLPPQALVFMDQTHGDNVQPVVGPMAAEVADCDGLVTAQADLGLAVMVADCVPVLLADPDAGVLAAVHAGRKGVQNGIVERAVERMTAQGASTSRLQVKLGPSICGSCYEVPEAMSNELLRVAPEATARTPAGTPGLDLRRGLAGVLRGLGVTQLELVGPCTRESAAAGEKADGAGDGPDGLRTFDAHTGHPGTAAGVTEEPVYYSYRQAAGRRTGRFAGVVWREASA